MRKMNLLFLWVTISQGAVQSCLLCLGGGFDEKPTVCRILCTLTVPNIALLTVNCMQNSLIIV